LYLKLGDAMAKKKKKITKKSVKKTNTKKKTKSVSKKKSAKKTVKVAATKRIKAAKKPSKKNSISGLKNLLGTLWKQYVKLTPQAERIHSLFESRGEKVLNDHVAFRTYNHPKLGIESLAQFFKKYGYQEMGQYHFVEKKLYAIHLEHKDSSLPKIFISELLIEQFPQEIQKIINGLCEQVPDGILKSEKFVTSGRPWNVDYATYQKLLTVSEYAAWMSAFGFCANHFTVNVNALKSFKSLEDLNSFLKSNGFLLNNSGGEIKGSPQVYLEQSSTLASKVSVAFSDSTNEIPSCYYEFAKRYAMDNGKLYQGFVEKSADKIFESTDVKM